MATIEERAKAVEQQSIEAGNSDDYSCGLYDGYIIGAKKQMNLDEDEVDDATAFGLFTKERFIEKACEWLSHKNIQRMNCGNGGWSLPQEEIEKFKQSMEE